MADANHEAAPTEQAPLIAFIHPAGLGSLGNAAIVDSLIAALRARIPRVRIIGFTSYPADTVLHHDVEAAFGMNSFSMPLFPVVTEPGVAPTGDQADHVPTVDDIPIRSGSGVRRVSRRLRLAIRHHRPQGSVFDVLVAAPRLLREPRALRELRVTLAGASTIVVGGGGQLNAEFGGLFGLPYVLWRFAHTARAVEARFAVLSVGTGRLGWPSRRLVRCALRDAGYRSFRDATSRELLRDPSLTAEDPIVPDLAYALPLPVPPLRDVRDVCVGVSPMNYRHPDFHARGSQEVYEELISALERICVHLLESGHRVVIFISDLSDEIARDDLTSRLERLPNDQWSRVTISRANTVASLWEAYAGLDAVVAVRMHAALLGHVAHRPVLAIEHDRKVATMMADMGHERFSFSPVDLDVHEVIGRLDDLLRDRHRLSEEIATAVERQRQQVEEQYDLVFGKRTDADRPRPGPSGAVEAPRDR